MHKVQLCISLDPSYPHHESYKVENFMQVYAYNSFTDIHSIIFFTVEVSHNNFCSYTITDENCSSLNLEISMIKQ